MIEVVAECPKLREIVLEKTVDVQKERKTFVHDELYRIQSLVASAGGNPEPEYVEKMEGALRRLSKLSPDHNELFFRRLRPLIDPVPTQNEGNPSLRTSSPMSLQQWEEHKKTIRQPDLPTPVCSCILTL